MTLLVAQCAGSNAWMVADSAITGGSIGEREREYALKIEPSLDGRALVGFSGDHYHGTRLIHHAASVPAGAEAIKVLREGHDEYPKIDFAYAYTDNVKLIAEEQTPHEIELSARDVDALLQLLSEGRLQLAPPVSMDPRREGPVRELVATDPAWRAERSVHTDLNGITLRLRHPGFGWLSFLLPWHEVKNLGDWLSKNATPPGIS